MFRGLSAGGAAKQATAPRDKAGRFVNWGRTVTSAPVRWHLPVSEDEVAAVVTRCGRDGRRLRVVGAGHSWSPIAEPVHEAMSLDGLQDAVSIDRERGEVTVPAGMRLVDVSARLARAGLALPVVGSIQAQSVAGAIATGTHGSSLTHGNLGTLVTGLRLVSGTGEVLTLRGDDERLAGARVHLGALGVVTSVTLRTTAARRLRQTIEHVPVTEVADALPAIATSAEWVKVWWLPHAPVAQVVRYDVTTQEPTRRPTPATQRWIDERVMHRFVFPAMVAAQARRPSITAPANTRLARRYLGAGTQVGADMLMLNTPMPLRHRETEAALPLTAAGGALKQVLAIFRDGRPAANFPLEIRFVRGDDSWLSPAYGADTCQVGAYSTDNRDCSAYFEAFWRVMRPAGARPHWGKEHDFEAAELRPLYPQWTAFAALRDRCDPGRVFGSAAMERLLG